MMFSHAIYSFSRGHKINASIKIDADGNRKYKIKTTETEKHTLPQPPCKKIYRNWPKMPCGEGHLLRLLLRGCKLRQIPPKRFDIFSPRLGDAQKV